MSALKPFTPFDQIKIDGSLEISGDQLLLNFEIDDPNHALREGPDVGQWKTWDRGDDLWKTTCFEAFLGLEGSEKYWEINLSPALRKWNLYAFDTYRAPQPPSPSHDLELLKVSTTKSSVGAEFKLKIPFENLEASLTAVVRTGSATHYFALNHAGAKPDFHLRASFILKRLG